MFNCNGDNIFIHTEKKTLKPDDVGGFAGGYKYIIGKMFVKFASDVYDLYDGDDHAAKAVSCISFL